MKSLNRMAKLLRRFAALVLAGAIFFPLASEAGPGNQPGYVALGDSIEFGIGDSDGIGYVPSFGTFVFGSTVDVHNFSQPGAEIRDILFHQLNPAIAEIQHHRPFGVVVSWGGGGNDLRHFIVSPQAATCLRTVSCLARINALLNEAERTVDLTLKVLRAVAGPESTILVRTQYNAFRKANCAAPELVALAEAALEGAPGTRLDRGLNDRLRTVAARHGAKVVEIFVPFALNADVLIADDCIHPNDAGYDVILDAFISAFEGP